MEADNEEILHKNINNNILYFYYYCITFFMPEAQKDINPLKLVIKSHIISMLHYIESRKK